MARKLKKEYEAKEKAELKQNKVYEVIYEGDLIVDGVKYKKGDKIENLEEEMAKRLIYYGYIKEVN